jgi:hypothetical protein
VAAISEHSFDYDLQFPCHENNVTAFPRDIFDDIKYLVQMAAEYGCRPVRDDDCKRQDHEYRTFVSQCLARAYTSTSETPTLNVAQSNAARCIGLAKMLFLYAHWPSVSVSGIYCQSTGLALRTSLEENCGQFGDRVRWSPEVLCWILVNGAVANHARDLKEWFLRRLADFTQRQKFESFDQFEALLRKVVWTERSFKSSCRELWAEISAD